MKKWNCVLYPLFFSTVQSGPYPTHLTPCPLLWGQFRPVPPSSYPHRENPINGHRLPVVIPPGTPFLMWFLCFLYLSIHSGQCGPSPYGTAHNLFSYFLVVSLAFSWVGCSSSQAHWMVSPSSTTPLTAPRSRSALILSAQNV